MKKSVIGIGMAMLVGMVVFVIAESEAINPARVTTPQINVYGAEPLQINGTNVTASAAMINRMTTGVDGVVTNLGAGNTNVLTFVSGVLTTWTHTP